jgi:DNA-binding LytR/AlgR family response regulator
MTTTAISTSQSNDLTPNLVIHHHDANQSENGNWKFLNADYLKGLAIEDTVPVMKLLNTIWQETERLIEKAVAKKEKEPKVESIFIKANDQIINLRLNDILWIEAYGDYVNFYTDKTRYVVHSTMKGIESKLPSDQFTRVHRSFIISTDKIDLIDESVIQIGKKLVPIVE